MVLAPKKLRTRRATLPSPSRSGMGAIPHDEGVAFRVWAPNANSVSVIGSFNDWEEEADLLVHEQNGYCR